VTSKCSSLDRTFAEDRFKAYFKAVLSQILLRQLSDEWLFLNSFVFCWRPLPVFASVSCRQLACAGFVCIVVFFFDSRQACLPSVQILLDFLPHGFYIIGAVGGWFFSILVPFYFLFSFLQFLDDFIDYECFLYVPSFFILFYFFPFGCRFLTV